MREIPPPANFLQGTGQEAWDRGAAANAGVSVEFWPNLIESTLRGRAGQD